MKLSAIDGVDWSLLFPQTAPPATIFDSLPKDNSIGNLLGDIQRIKDIYIQFKYGKIALFQNDAVVQSDLDYGYYLQFPNDQVKSLAMSIVSRSDSDDEKAWKLLRWVEDNVQYKDDISNYGRDEYWALPTLTIKKRTGDCEDGAFLLGSLMLNAGVDPDRVRVYGGFVSAGTNASTGGHAWVAYKRQVDNQWVALDWCYYPTEEQINDRRTLKTDTKYVDDYFYIDPFETVDTSYMNTLRAEGIQKAYVLNHQPRPVSILDLVV